MKKFINILLVTSTSLVPMSTIASCGTNYVEQYQMFNMLDTATYPQTIDPLERSSAATQELATNLYVDNAKNNADIFTTDLIYGLHDSYDEILKQNVYEDRTLTAGDVGIIKPTFGVTHIWQMGQGDRQCPTISFKLRIHLSYKQDVEDNIHIDQDIVVNIEYKDVIFLVTENDFWSRPNDDNLVPRGNVGILDSLLDYESVGVHRYNINPWYIRYGCVDQETQTIKGIEGTPDVKIHNTEYYSGEIKTAEHLYDIYSSATHSDSHVFTSKLEQTILQMLLLQSIQSKYFKNIINKPTIRLSNPLQAVVAVGSHSLMIDGLKFIPSNDPRFTSQVAIVLTTNHQDIELYEEKEINPNSIKIGTQARLIDVGVSSPYQMSGGLTEDYTDKDIGQTKIFNLPTSQLIFNIVCTYADNPDKQETTSVAVETHYNSVSLNIVPTEEPESKN